MTSAPEPPIPAGREQAALDRRRLLVIHNPVAGRGRQRRFRAVLQQLEALDCGVALRETSRPGDATRLAREAGPADADVLVAAGGDGTINEIVNGLVGDRGPARLPLAILPLGTSNVLAAEIGLGSDPAAVARTIVSDCSCSVSLGRISDATGSTRAFVLMAGAGVDAHAVADVDPTLKRWLGPAAYVWAALRQAWRSGGVTYHAVIDGAPYEAASLIVANGSRYGGPFVVARAARIDEPLFQVCLFGRGGPVAMLCYAGAVVLGQLHRVPSVRIMPATRVRIEGPVGEPVQADGDILAHLPADIEIVPDALTLLVPPDGRYGRE
jgi:YegS/Rv2252/BmrU family lipid kinase